MSVVKNSSGVTQVHNSGVLVASPVGACKFLVEVKS